MNKVYFVGWRNYLYTSYLEDNMSLIRKILIVTTITAVLLLGVDFFAHPAQAVPLALLADYSGIPTFSIVSVDEDVSVSIKTKNLPPNDKFEVTMGLMGTRGIDGTKVATVDSGSGGSKEYTFDIPDSLQGLYQISIRMESPTSGYYAYNWFYNSTSGDGTQPPSTTTPEPGYSGYPTFSIVSVEQDEDVTIKTKNLPPNDTFDVTMGPMGTKGVDGTEVDSVDSGSGGSMEFTFDIPSDLEGSYQISIRMESPTSGYFAYNWFYNNTSNGDTQSPTSTPSPPSGYTGYPTFSILSVVRDVSVTVQTKNLPPDDEFVVRMGPMGTKGVDGTKVATISSGSGGSKQFAFDIPSALQGSYRISIRMQSSTSGYYAYNWFYNNTASAP
jgi:hypothetical protein